MGILSVIVCHLIHPVYTGTYSLSTVHIAHSLKRSGLKSKCTYLFNLCSSILCIVTLFLHLCLCLFLHLYLCRTCIQYS